MGIFSKKPQVTFEQIDRLLAAIPSLELGEAKFSPRTLAGGWRKTTALPGIELQIGELTGWLELEETIRYVEGTFSVHETWKDSPALFFISTPASTPVDSAAGEALSGVPATDTGILHPGENGELTLLTTLSEQQLLQLKSWMRVFPRV